MTRKQLISEILTGLRKYDDLGLIDLRTVNLLIKNELKRFGPNITENRQAFVDVVGGVGNLPETFFRLKSAHRTTPKSIDSSNALDNKWLNTSYITRVKETEYEWDNHSNSHYKKAFTEVIEERLIRGSQIFITHALTERVALVKGLSKDYLSNDCINKKIGNDYRGTVISVNNTTITSNEADFTLFIEYEAMPEQDGDLFIPDLPNLVNYLISQISYKVLESIWINDEADTVAQKVQYLRGQATSLWIPAMTEVKFSRLSPNIGKRIKAQNKKDLRKFSR